MHLRSRERTTDEKTTITATESGSEVGTGDVRRGLGACCAVVSTAVLSSLFIVLFQFSHRELAEKVPVALIEAVGYGGVERQGDEQPGGKTRFKRGLLLRGECFLGAGLRAIDPHPDSRMLRRSGKSPLPSAKSPLATLSDRDAKSGRRERLLVFRAAAGPKRAFMSKSLLLSHGVVGQSFSSVGASLKTLKVLAVSSSGGANEAVELQHTGNGVLARQVP